MNCIDGNGGFGGDSVQVATCASAKTTFGGTVHTHNERGSLCVSSTIGSAK